MGGARIKGASHPLAFGWIEKVMMEKCHAGPPCPLCVFGPWPGEGFTLLVSLLFPPTLLLPPQQRPLQVADLLLSVMGWGASPSFIGGKVGTQPPACPPACLPAPPVALFFAAAAADFAGPHGKAHVLLVCRRPGGGSTGWFAANPSFLFCVFFLYLPQDGFPL